ncbi:MAG: hypothetical protein R3F50_08055 [Gammaproteobacteria bacterium]
MKEDNKSDPIDFDNHVIITDIHMPFMSMVTFMVKWVLAAIPALIILGVMGTLGAVFLSGLVEV